MPVGRATEIEERDGEILVLGEANLVHVEGGIDRILGRAADEGHDRRGGCHGKAADPRGLGDRAVADIRVGVFFGEAGK